MKIRKRFPIWLQIIAGMILGLIWGLLAIEINAEIFTLNWIKPWGTIFLNLLKLIAVPLIFVSLVKGISSLTDIARLSRIGLKTLGLYILTTIFAISLGLVFVNILKPGDVFPAEKKAEYSEKFGANLIDKQQDASKIQEESPMQFIVDIVPENIVEAASDNSNMLQVIFFAILFGVAMILLPAERTEYVRRFFDDLNEIILKIIDLIMKFAPYGVFALMAGLIVDFSGDREIFSALGLYMLTVLLALILILLIFYPILARVFAGIPVLSFLKGVLPIQLVAMSTSSSAATLPVTMKQTTKAFGVSPGVANFVLPVGVTINMDGTSCYQAVAAVFIAQVFGIDLSFGQQLLIILTALVSSIGTPGIPGGSVVIMIIVLKSVGLPVEGLALILGVDRPLDMIRTAVNVTGDSAVSCIIAKSEGELNFPPDEVIET